MHLVRTQNLQKTNISYLVMYTRTCAYQGVEIVSFTKFCVHTQGFIGIFIGTVSKKFGNCELTNVNVIFFSLMC